MEIQNEMASRKLKITSKRLKSGKVQVRFTMSSSTDGVQYGYMLAEPRTSLREVVNEIVQNVSTTKEQVFHAHLFNIGKVQQKNKVILF
jgi:hypothetical protein